jgi:hypothetical protein
LPAKPSAEALQALHVHDADGSGLRIPQRGGAPDVLCAAEQRRAVRRLIDLLLLRAPTAALFKALFEAVVVNSDGAIKNEATFQYHVALALSELCRPADIRLEVRADYTRGDVLLLRKDGVLVLELKYVPLDSLTLGERPLSKLDDQELLLLPTTAQSSHMPEAGKSVLVRKVAHIVLGAQQQAAEHAAALRSSDAASKHGITAETPLHAWVAVLVGGERVVVRAAC